MPGIDRALAIQRLMVAILGHEYLRQQARARQAASNRPRRCTRLHNAVATPARQLRPHATNDLKAGGNEFQGFANVFTQVLARTAACRAVARVTTPKPNIGRASCREECGSTCRSRWSLTN